MSETREITLTKEAIESLNRGEFIVIEWDKEFLLKVTKYTFDEQLKDAFFEDEDEIVFEAHMKKPKRKEK